jgi:hypothetical protein
METNLMKSIILVSLFPFSFAFGFEDPMAFSDEVLEKDDLLECHIEVINGYYDCVASGEEQTQCDIDLLDSYVEKCDEYRISQ